MVELAADTARYHSFDEKSLRLSMSEITRNSYRDGTTVNEALKEDWKRGISHAMADGTTSHHEERHLRLLRVQLVLNPPRPTPTL